MGLFLGSYLEKGRVCGFLSILLGGEGLEGVVGELLNLTSTINMLK